MATRRPRHPLLQLPAKHGAREQALKMVQRATDQCGRLADPADLEALHDFRVAVRKLRSFLRAYEPFLELGQKPRKGLRRISRSTNVARDAEVGLVWIEAQRSAVQPRHRAGLSWLSRRLEAEKVRAYDLLRREVPSAWAAEESPLREALCLPFFDEVRAGTFAQASGRLIERTLGELTGQLGQIDPGGDEEHVHQARIQGKKLRYLLEPFKGSLPEVKRALTSMKEFQDLLGDFNDAHVMLGRLRQSIQQAAADRAGRLLDLIVDGSADEATLRRVRRQNESAGLLEVARRAGERKVSLLAEIGSRFLEAGEPEFVARVREVIEALQNPTRSPLRLVQPPPVAEDSEPSGG